MPRISETVDDITSPQDQMIAEGHGSAGHRPKVKFLEYTSDLRMMVIFCTCGVKAWSIPISGGGRTVAVSTACAAWARSHAS